MTIAKRPIFLQDLMPAVLRDSADSRWSWRSFLVALLIPTAFSAIAWASAEINFLVFHVTAELFSIVIASTALIVALTSRRFTQNHFVVFLAVAIGWCGGIDLLHTLTYKGMGLLPVNESNLATQLWIVARFEQAVALLIAPLFLAAGTVKRDMRWWALGWSHCCWWDWR